MTSRRIGSGEVQGTVLLDVYLAMRPSLMRYFAAKMRSAAAAEDLVQELYLKIQGLQPSTDIHDPKAWLFRAAANLLIDRRRRQMRESARESSWAQADNRFDPEPRSPEPSAEAVLSGRQRLGKLLGLVEQMPPRMAQAFRLHKLDGLTQTEAAHRMGISIKAVEKHLAGALRRIVESSDGDFL